MKGQINEQHVLYMGLALVVGVIIILVMVGRINSAAWTKCWQEVNRPFTSVDESLTPGKSIDLCMDPACMDSLVITRSEEKCRAVCGTYKECSANCLLGEGGKTFFIVVRKEGASGISGIGSWITNPLNTARQTLFDQSRSYVLMCSLDVETILCTPKEDSRYVRFFIEGKYKDICRIRAKAGLNSLPENCRVESG